MGNVTIPQPTAPFVKVWIGDKEITESPKRRLKRFEYHLGTIPSQGNQIEMELVDTEWTEIEDLLVSEYGQITFEFGWLGSKDEKLWTKEKRVMRIVKYVPQIHESYSIITLYGLTLAKMLDSPDTTASETNNLQISRIIEGTSFSKFVQNHWSKEKGWNVEGVEETAEFAKVHCGTEGTMAERPIYMLTGETALQLVNNYLRYRSVEPGDKNKTVEEKTPGQLVGTQNMGRGGYLLFFDDTDPPKVFLTLGVDEKNSLLKGTYDWPVVTDDTREVISFEYEMNIPMSGSIWGYHGTKTTAVENNTGNTFTIDSVTKDSIYPGPHKKAPDTPLQPPPGYSASEKIYIDTGGRSQQETRDFVTAIHGYKANLVYRSSLVILGRTDLRLGHQIKMNVWAYKLVDGQLVKTIHWSSGTWVILEIKHEITPGKFVSVLDMKKLSNAEQHTGGQIEKSDQKEWDLGDSIIPNNTSYKQNFDG